MPNLHPPIDADHIPTALRALATQIELGEFDLVTTAVVVIGHTEEIHYLERDYSLQKHTHEVFGMGPRHDHFTVMGLLATAIQQPLGTGGSQEE